MLRLPARFMQWWFGFTLPRDLASASIAERERSRKARLLSMASLAAGILGMPLAASDIITRVPLNSFLVLVFFESIHIGASVANRFGRVALGSVIYITGYMISATLGIVVAPPHAIYFPLWQWMQLIIPIIFAGLFLPFWSPLLFAAMNSVLATIIIQTVNGGAALAILSPAQQAAFFIYLYVMMGAVGIICTVQAYTSHKALIEADRGVELESVNRDLVEAHSVLEMMHADLNRAYAQMTDLATTDMLTGMLNHRALEDRLINEVERARRLGTTFAVIFADLDHFKRINDTYGHPCGDAVLAHLANIMRTEARMMDITARYGGEEFVMVLPEQSVTDAMVAAERLRRAVEATPFLTEDGEPVPLTASLGVAAFPKDGDAHAVMAAADAAMYRAKREGRNRVASTLEAVAVAHAGDAA